MKTILIMLSTLLALATSSAQAVTVTVQSEMTVISDPDNSLVVYKITEAMRIPNVPEGISAGNAYDLVTGKLKEVAVKGKKIRDSQLSFSSPFEIAVSPTAYADTIFTYGSSAWSGRTIERQEKSSGTFENFVLLWAPALFILSTILVTRKVLVVSMAMLIGFLGSVAGQPWWCGLLLLGVMVFTTINAGGGNARLYIPMFIYMYLSATWMLILAIGNAIMFANNSHAFLVEYAAFVAVAISVGLLIKWAVAKMKDAWGTRHRPGTA